MKIEVLWQELEKEAAVSNDGAKGWLLRTATADPEQKLCVGVERSSKTRAILLLTSRALIPARSAWPECQGLELFNISVGNAHYFGVALRDAANSDVFTVLANDVACHVAPAGDEAGAMKALLARLRRWQLFLSEARNGLSREAQRGLWGELHVLAWFAQRMGIGDAVGAWRAPTATHQDFQFPLGSIEVKTSAAKQPQSVRITSERQLDQTGVGALFLHVVTVDERDVPAVQPGTGLSLPQLVAKVRALVATEPLTQSVFEGRLLDAGYRQLHEPKYEDRRWTIRAERSYRVTEGFPRLVEAQLPVGVGDVSYAISLASCEPFAADSNELIAAVTSAPA